MENFFSAKAREYFMKNVKEQARDKNKFAVWT